MKQRVLRILCRLFGHIMFPRVTWERDGWTVDPSASVCHRCGIMVQP